ncbi:hypothetical protein L3073_18385 [Ancylomarina sp. DW003]|uniref:DUF3784 domain-containing protein n=1 Tax=Paralabilibaculum antarcticum TaxID=2912572 RepID=A0ABT5VRJ4_9BACT|nr:MULTISPECIES: hypothetical protein [Marinifilaceae]MDE5417902.1 hypothetical protein [Labilibaculum sp. DW002]MDE5424187.1 hypothetical protein [Ancylomarina sp. DW003]
MNIGELLMAAVVFFSIITFVKMMSSHFLKRKIIKTGHFDRAEILDQNTEVEVKKQVKYDQFPALKWGLVAFFGGLGFIAMEVIGMEYPIFKEYRSAMPYGIFFVSVSIGFLAYYFIMSRKINE